MNIRTLVVALAAGVLAATSTAKAQLGATQRQEAIQVGDLYAGMFDGVSEDISDKAIKTCALTYGCKTATDIKEFLTIARATENVIKIARFLVRPNKMLGGCLNMFVPGFIYELVPKTKNSIISGRRWHRSSRDEVGS